MPVLFKLHKLEALKQQKTTKVPPLALLNLLHPWSFHPKCFK